MATGGILWVAVRVVKNMSGRMKLTSEMISYYDKKNFDELALKIRIRRDCRMAIVQSLNQMNVNHEVLFPGIEGFCRSLYFKLSLL